MIWFLDSGNLTSVPEQQPRLMARSEADVFSCSTSISACGRCQHWELSLSLWCGFARGTVEPNAVAYGAICSACSLGRPELCGEFMEAMQKQRLRPNLIVCNVALSCFLDLDRWPEALQLLAEMDTSGPEPNAVSLRAVAEAMALTSRSSRPLLCRLDVAVRQLLYPGRGAGTRGRSRFSSFAPLSSSVEAVEVLQEHSALAADMSSAVRRCLVPHKVRIRSLTRTDMHHQLAKLESLEPLFGLGAQETWELLQELGLATAWVPAARLCSRRSQLQLKASARPAAQTTLAWRACLLRSGLELCWAGAPVSYGAASNALLTPIRVEHDRGLHPERRALAALLTELLQREKTTHGDRQGFGEPRNHQTTTRKSTHS